MSCHCFLLFAGQAHYLNMYSVYTGSHGDSVTLGIHGETDLSQIASPLGEEFNGCRFHEESVLTVGTLHSFHSFLCAFDEDAGTCRFHKCPHSKWGDHHTK